MSIRIDYCADLRRSLSNGTASMPMSKKPCIGRGWSPCGRIRRIWEGCMVGIDIRRLHHHHHHHHLVRGDRVLRLSHGDSRALIQGRSIKAQNGKAPLNPRPEYRDHRGRADVRRPVVPPPMPAMHPPPPPPPRTSLRQQDTTADSSHRPSHQIKHQAASHGLDLDHGEDRRALRSRSGRRTLSERRKDSRGRSRDCRHPGRPETATAQSELRKTYCSRSSRDIDDRRWE